jgi:ribonuclease PH
MQNTNHFVRSSRRANDELRPLRVTYDIYSYASGSVLFEIGKTRVLCSVTLQRGVPHFLRGKRRGWLTAEYSMLPASTPVRSIREGTSNKRNGRTVEISRLIGRALRSTVALDVLGEQTIFVDCDILQADGGTRTACITAACLALKAAEKRWIEEGILQEPVVREEVAAVSTGLGQNIILLDMDFEEDNMIAADFNFVFTRSGKIVEIQGTAEKYPVSSDLYLQAWQVAQAGAQELFNFIDMNPYRYQPYSTYSSLPESVLE